MEIDEFIQLCSDVRDSAKTGTAGESKTYFTSIYIGYEYPNITPPTDDQNAIRGYRFGLELRERFK